MVPSFAETYEALQKVKAFFYAPSGSDADRENILSLEKSYFQLMQNSAKKQRTMYDFFLLKSSFFKCSVFMLKVINVIYLFFLGNGSR